MDIIFSESSIIKANDISSIPLMSSHNSKDKYFERQHHQPNPQLPSLEKISFHQDSPNLSIADDTSFSEKPISNNWSVFAIIPKSFSLVT